MWTRVAPGHGMFIEEDTAAINKNAALCQTQNPPATRVARGGGSGGGVPEEPGKGAAGESDPLLGWVAVPKALRARRAIRCRLGARR